MKLTIAEIAKMANVSKATISRVINNKQEGMSKETKAKILKIIDDVGYRPSLLARSMVTSETKSIGLIIPDITNPFYPKLVRGVEDYANSKGYTVYLCNADKSVEKEKDYISAFIERRVDGVILASSSAEKDKTHEGFVNHNIPFVLIDDRSVEGLQATPGVFFDYKEGAYMATKHLISNGNRKIVFISGPNLITNSLNRFKGYKKALKEAGIPFDDKLVKYGDYSLKSGYELVEELLNEKINFTAIFAANDLMAIGAMKALKKKSIKIPDDVEVIGFDNTEFSEIIEPALTTIEQPIYEMTLTASKLLIDLITGKKPKKKNFIIPPKLILRETTKG
jgi:LacI family transcriptional regulator